MPSLRGELSRETDISVNDHRDLIQYEIESNRRWEIEYVNY